MLHTHSLGRGARYFSDRTALASGEKRFSFRELHDRVAGVAAALIRRGLGAGDRLAILLPNIPEYIELVYACSWLGVIAVPLNARLSATEIDHVLVDAAPKGLIRHSSLSAPTAPGLWQRVLDQEPLDASGDSFPEAIYDPDAILALIYTSGTTGRPKGVVQTHASILADIDHVNYWLPFPDGGVCLHAAPLFHILEFPFMFAMPAFGTCQVTIPKFSPRSFCEAVERERVSHTVLVPTMMNSLAQFADLGKFDLSSLEQVAYGGSPIAPELLRRTRQLLPKVKLAQGYGLSEAGFLSALRDNEHTEARLLSCGRPCPGIDLRVVDDSGKEVPPGHAGELVARGANIMRGYWNNSKETALVFRDGLFRTGDIGYRDTEGYFFILDRLKDMIVTGGENVYSGEVEAIISTHPAIQEVAVFGIPDSQWGEVVMACVVAKPGAIFSVDDLVAHCRRFLAHYKVPRRIEVVVGELPKNGAGKILKTVLRERFWAGRVRGVG